jgi:hypothetical protein
MFLPFLTSFNHGSCGVSVLPVSLEPAARRGMDGQLNVAVYFHIIRSIGRLSGSHCEPFLAIRICPQSTAARVPARSMPTPHPKVAGGVMLLPAAGGHQQHCALPNEGPLTVAVTPSLICLKPRKLNVSGLPRPFFLRLSAAKRPTQSGGSCQNGAATQTPATVHASCPENIWHRLRA